MPSLTGVSQVICTQTGKNLFNKDATPYQTGKYIISTSVIGSSDFTYTNNANYNVYRIKIEKNTSYVISSIKANAPCWGLMSTSGLVTYVYPNNGGSEGVNITLTTGATDAYLFVSVAVTGTYKCDDVVQVEVGTTATAYEAYTAPTVTTVSLGRTIYGGSVDVVAGTGSTKVHKQTYTGDNVGTVSITYGQAAEGYTHLYFNIADIPLAYNPSSDNVISNITLPWNNNASAAGIPAVGECWRLINGGSPQKPIIYMYIHQTWANVAAFKTWLNASPITVVYEVADDETFTFTPISPTPETALGVNNFWADEGDSEVTYRADISLLLGGN